MKTITDEMGTKASEGVVAGAATGGVLVGLGIRKIKLRNMNTM
ncbi:MAG TPA: hypothetical protein VGI33_20575 [Paenibacillus sp.]